MRLIDADLLKKNCKCTGKFEDNFMCVNLIELAKVIDAQPTAYSVEKVIAELEGRKEELIEDLDYEIILGQYRAYQDAIKVIREGVE